ncbi:DUF4245 domain-containing protein [Streptomyces sp. NPDC006997]|uniref:DUF4245 domain-containing protein n=1 Tax=Streptomyces sp. NPDC006997 TaxID=3155356 RepID=UPI0033ED3398
MAGTNGKQKTIRGMVLSLLVCLLAAGVIYLFTPHDDKEPDLPRVDYRIELLTARRAADYPVAAPEGLPEGWKPTSVRYKGEPYGTWHLGYHAPDGEYVAIGQSTEQRKRFIKEASQGATATEDTEEIGGRTWTRYTGGRYDALVLEESADGKGSTTVVAGTGSFEQLARMAGALKMS